MKEQKKIKVLLVDDSQMIKDTLRKIIEEQGNQTVIGEASSGEEAIQFVQENKPDVVAMDVNLPEIDGIEVTKLIKDIMPEAIVIGLSVHNSPHMTERMLNAGASSYIAKDEAFEKLCATIRNEVK